MFWIVAGLVLVALFFDYINGFHDAANSIATVVSTRVLSPGKAVIWAAFFNFVAAFTFGTAVAKTVGSGMIDVNVVTFAVILAGLVGAIVWDLITWYSGLPTSSSHALIGGYARAAGAPTRRGGRESRLGGDRAGRLDENADVHRPLAAHRHAARSAADDGDSVDFPLDAAVARRSLVPAPATAVGRVLQPEPRRQRRAEDDGDHRRGAVRGRVYPDLRHPVLGGARRAYGHRPGDARRRLAHHPHDGIEDHQASAGRRLRRGDQRCDLDP